MRFPSTLLCLAGLILSGACQGPQAVKPAEPSQERTETEEEDRLRPVIPPSVLIPRPNRLRPPILLGR